MNNQNGNPAATLVFVKCTSCGAEMQADISQECIVCPSCGQPFVTVKGVQNYNAQHGMHQADPSVTMQQAAEPPKKKHTLLWVLGWIFCFPIPLTILMLRNKTMNKKVKYGIIAAGWIVYLILMISGQVRNKQQDRNTPTEPASVADTTPSEEEKPATTKAKTTTAPQKATEPEAITETQPVETEPREEESSEAELSLQDIKDMIANGDYSLVTPEFKQTMDAYEAFYDDYLAFMNRYNSGEGDVMAMLNDYMTMMSDMEEWTKKIDAIDESKLSPADDAYYLLVTLRIEKKLMNAM